MAQQYVNTQMVLENIANKCTDYDTYCFDAMLELSKTGHRFKEGEYLIPERIVNHRLYVKSTLGNNLGYISFKDDRLYYGVIPLLERKSAMVKMTLEDSTLKKSCGKPYVDVNMQIRLNNEDRVSMLESINLQIKNRLDEY